MLGLVYSLHKFLENRSHQLHCSECMDRIKELSQVNRNWPKQTNLNNLSCKGMRETMKVMWKKRWPKDKEKDEQSKKNMSYLWQNQTQFLSLFVRLEECGSSSSPVTKGVTNLRKVSEFLVGLNSALINL